MRILGIGEVVWDVFGDDEHLGGAPLHVCINAARLGHESAILTGLGRDDRGERALAEIEGHGVSTRFVARSDELPTGAALVELDVAGSPTFTLVRPAAYDTLDASPAAVDAIAAWAPDWIVFGTLAQSSPSARHATRAIVLACPDAARLYDVNLRRPYPAVELVADLLGLATVVKVNEDEAVILADMLGWPQAGQRLFVERLAASFGVRAACVTRGGAGSALLLDGAYVEVPAEPVAVVDTVGAGDAYSTGLVHGIGAGWPPARVATFAGRLAGIVASRRSGTPDWTPDELGGA